MNIIIEHKKENTLLSRTELKIDLTYEGATPSRMELRKKIAAHIGAAEELVVIKKVDVSYGFQKAVVTAYVYKTKQELDKLEPPYLLTRCLPKEERAKKAAAKPKEAKEEAKE